LTGADLPTILAEERRIMDLWAPDYDRAALSNAYVYRLERAEFVTWVVETLRTDGRDLPTLSVLDAGCGTGDVIERLSREGVTNLTGLDLAEGMLSEARKRRVRGARWVEGAIEDPPFDAETFDVVVACFTVHHLVDPGAFFRLVELTLRPGGWFFILELDSAWETWGSSRRGKISRAAGNLVRAAFAHKNRHALAAQPELPHIFTAAHRPRAFNEILQSIENPDEYELRHQSRGVLLPALTPVLVEESRFDRTLARWAGAVDRQLTRRTDGVFQWVAGRMRGP
jgi:ubiquinone/menaquinone biosynthesis C-methylase UbiE